ncbi:MAG: Slp family lipoprotein [Nitrospirae bacterium]|nr:Slp family lipoprotein [Nitrospirota bacterium]
MEKVISQGPARIIRVLLIFFPVILSTGGCAIFNPPTFTERQLSGVDTTLSYSAILHNHRELEGQKVVVGGRTVHLDNRTTRAYVQLDPAPLDRNFRPGAPDATSGLLLLVFPYPVDPSALRDGQRITVIATVRRMKRPALTDSGRTLRLVTLDVLFLHTWVPETAIMGGSPYPVMTPGFTGPYQVP